MNTTYTALSISVKMAPGPDNRQELVAPDKSHEEEDSNDVIVVDTSSIDVETTVIDANTNDVSSVVNSSNPSDAIAEVDKQEEPATLSTLNERELRALLDEAITYTGSTRDREGKSNLFKELLHEAQVDETEEGRRVVASSRCIPGSNRTRRHKRDSVSERLTHGGSLQNLAQPINSEFDSSFAYLTSGSSHTYGGGRRKNKKHTGPSVSARQREGGSLPSNVNASHSLASLVNLDLIFDKKRGFCEERTVCDWTNKEKSKSLDKPSYGCVTKKDDKEREKKESAVVAVTNVEICETERKCSKIKQTTNDMVEVENSTSDYKPDFMVIDIEVNGLSDRNAISGNNNIAINSQRSSSQTVHDGGGDDEGTEMKIIEPRRPMQLISRATFETVDTPVDSAIEFPLREHHSIKQQDNKGKITINGTLQLTTYNNAKCIGNGAIVSGASQQTKITGSSTIPVMQNSGPQPNIAMAVSRLTAQNTTTKEFSLSIDKKSVDENGNAVQGNTMSGNTMQGNAAVQGQNGGGERKKSRRKHAQEPNVIVYKAENVEGHRNDDIDSLINFIENKDSKGKKGGKNSGNAVKVKTATGTKPRSREKDSKREQMPAKLHKSNSLEEISKTKMEDLTSEGSSGDSSISSQRGAINGAVRRAKQRSTGDSGADCRGDRRSWGTEEGQSIYCNDIGDDYSSSNVTRRNTTRKMNADIEQEPEFLVVTKKKKSKRQRRSSSGGRPQNLASSASYLPRSRDFGNAYRTQHAPELRRKSTSSMPPSDKSDSSDVDSVHSLPVTSNSKHNLNKSGSSSDGQSQASYAEITRTPTTIVSQSAVVNSTPQMNTTPWTAVANKSPSEPDHFPRDYPTLDETSHTERKTKQNNFANSNYTSPVYSSSFDKPPSPIESKCKTVSETAKKAEAREEAFNKKIQVIKYVEEQKNLNANVNFTTNQSDNQAISQAVPLKLRNSGNNNSLDETNIECFNVKDGNFNVRIASNPRPNRRNYQQNSTNSLDNAKKSSANVTDDMKKLLNPQDDLKKSKNSVNDTQEEHGELKFKIKPILPVVQMCQNEVELKSTTVKVEASLKLPIKEPPPPLLSKDDDVEHKKSNKIQANSSRTTDSSHQQHHLTRKSARKIVPAVMMMDGQRNETSSELTFGFEVNTQLLQSEDEATNISENHGNFINESTTHIAKNKSNFDRTQSVTMDNKSRFNKFPSNLQVQPTTPPALPLQQSFPPYPQHHHHHHHHQLPHPPIIVPYHLGYPPRFPPANTYISSPPPLQTPTPIDHKVRLPIGNLTLRWKAPPKVNTQAYNHDKIVTYIGLGWDTVTREMVPVATSLIKPQYYNSQ